MWETIFVKVGIPSPSYSGLGLILDSLKKVRYLDGTIVANLENTHGKIRETSRQAKSPHKALSYSILPFPPRQQLPLRASTAGFSMAFSNRPSHTRLRSTAIPSFRFTQLEREPLLGLCHPGKLLLLLEQLSAIFARLGPLFGDVLRSRKRALGHSSRSFPEVQPKQPKRGF